MMKCERFLCFDWMADRSGQVLQKTDLSTEYSSDSESNNKTREITRVCVLPSWLFCIVFIVCVKCASTYNVALCVAGLSVSKSVIPLI